MKRIVSWGIIVCLIYIGATLYSEGSDTAFGGALSWTSRTSEAEAEELLSNTSVYTDDVPEGSARKSVPMTHAVRDRVTEHMNTAAQRHVRAGDQ